MRELSAKLTEGEINPDNRSTVSPSASPVGERQIVNQVQHFLLKFLLEFSNQDTSWDGY